MKDLYADSSTSELGLFLSPKNCVIKNQNSACSQRIDLQWTLESSKNVCLFIATQELNLACWQNVLFHQMNVSINADKDIIFELRNQSSGKVIYREPFKVYRKITKFRRKRRNPWSFY